MFFGSVFVEIDWQRTIFRSQLFRHGILFRIRNDHPCPSNPDERHSLLQARQCSGQTTFRQFILVSTLEINTALDQLWGAYIYLFFDGDG